MFPHFTSQNINQRPLFIPHTTNHVLHHTVTNQIFAILVEIKKLICLVVKFAWFWLTLVRQPGTESLKASHINQ